MEWKVEMNTALTGGFAATKHQTVLVGEKSRISNTDSLHSMVKRIE